MIGIFDSGLGGLALWRELDRLLPNTDLLYLADNGAFPYGPRPPQFLKNRTEKIARALLERGARLVVVACNTATVVAIAHLRERFDIPFVGVEPPVKVAAGLAAPDEPIYVLLTENTASGEKYTALVERFGAGRKVKAVCLALLARVVEDGSFREPAVAREVARTVREAVGEISERAKVVLGCTHYVFLRELLQEALGPKATILEPSRAVAEQVLRLMAENGIPREETGRREFFCTGDPALFSLNAARLLEAKKLEVERVEI